MAKIKEARPNTKKGSGGMTGKGKAIHAPKTGVYQFPKSGREKKAPGMPPMRHT